MSQSSVNCSPKRPPKRFLKKGEGLKRFAAYKPPLPVSTSQLQRRQTFVKFKQDLKKSNPSYPDLPEDDSINLSTEVPKIAPPKIMHTPLRPMRTALGTSNFNSPYVVTPDFRGLNEITQKSFNRKVTFVQPPSAKKISFRKPATPSPVKSPVAQEESPPRRYNLRGSRKPSVNLIAPAKETKKSRRQAKAVVERHITPAKVPLIESDDTPLTETTLTPPSVIDTPVIETPVIDPRKSHEMPRVIESSPPTPGNMTLALERHIQQIEAALGELKRKIIPEAANTRIKKKTAREGPSVLTDSSIRSIYHTLVDDVAKLGSKFDEINLKR